MSLFMYVNSPEMMETEGKLCGKNLSMEMSLFLIYVRKFCGNEGL